MLNFACVPVWMGSTQSWCSLPSTLCTFDCFHGISCKKVTLTPIPIISLNNIEVPMDAKNQSRKYKTYSWKADINHEKLIGPSIPRSKFPTSTCKMVDIVTFSDKVANKCNVQSAMAITVYAHPNVILQKECYIAQYFSRLNHKISSMNHYSITWENKYHCLQVIPLKQLVGCLVGCWLVEWQA